MTVESNYVIAIGMLTDWLKKSRASFSTNEKQKQNQLQVSHDHRSYESNLSNCVEKPEKVRTSTGFEPVTSRYRCDALTNSAMKPLTLGAGHL